MVPPGDVKYFFTISGELTTAADQDIVNGKFKFGPTSAESISVKKTNILRNIQKNREILSRNLIPNPKCVPRPEPKELPEPEVEPEIWCLEKSIFARYKNDSEELLTECFEFDWRCSRIERLCRYPE